jgi:hypothetical protein
MRWLKDFLMRVIGLEPAPEMGPVTVTCIYGKFCLWFSTKDGTYVYFFTEPLWHQAMDQIIAGVEQNLFSLEDAMRAISFTEELMDRHHNQGGQLCFCEH